MKLVDARVDALLAYAGISTGFWRELGLASDESILVSAAPDIEIWRVPTLSLHGYPSSDLFREGAFAQQGICSR